MKNQNISVLFSITLLFIGFLLGFLVGRSHNPEPVLVSVPAQMQTMPTVSETSEEEIEFPVDLNKATREELIALPGIGEKLTLRIMAYRRERGRFFALEDLLQIEGVTKKTLDKIRDFVYIGG